jgi:hypothetical protein
MEQVTLSGGDMGGTVVETDAGPGEEIQIVSDAGETAGLTLSYRRDSRTQAVYAGVKAKP